MVVNTIHIVNFERDLKSADVIVETANRDSYLARINHIDLLLQKIKDGHDIQSKTNYEVIAESLVVDDIDEANMFDMVQNLIEDGNFYRVFKKI